MSNDPDANMFELLTAKPPSLSCGDAERIAREHYGVQGSAQPLSSERDQNFLLSAQDGQRFVLKIANPLEDPAVTDCQTQALLHLALAAPDLPVPQVCRTTDGATETSVPLGPDRHAGVRLITYLPGVVVATVESTPALRGHMGRHLARLARHLRDFSHPGAEHAILWDIKNAARLADLVPEVSDPEQRSHSARYVQNFVERVLPVLPGLRSQVIHNDLNPSNVLVDAHDPERIVGIIDFGDLVRSPLILDVAVAAAYQVRHTTDPFEAASELVSGYHSVTPLEGREIDLLYDLIATRLATSVIVSNWRAGLYPENRDYLLRNVPPNWRVLRSLNELSRRGVRERLRAACQ